jgi:hypothetical protein
MRNLQLVTGKLCFVRCLSCGEHTAIGDGADKFRHSPGKADLNGEPFKAYYCPDCQLVIETPLPPYCDTPNGRQDQ